MPAKAAVVDLPMIYPARKPLPPGEFGALVVREFTEEPGQPPITEKLDDLRSCEPLVPDWKPVRAVFEGCPADDDFYHYCLGAFAVSERARRVIEPRTGERVEFLPVQVVARRDQDDEPVRALPAEEQRELYIVRPLELARLSAAAKFKDLGIMLLVDRYAFDWDTMEGRHWFRIAGDCTTIVSAEMRAAIEQAGLVGLSFDKPIKYLIGEQARAIPRKRVAPVTRPASPDGTPLKATAAVWKSWTAHWKWIGTAVRARGGTATPLNVSKPISQRQLKTLESRLGYRLPREFTDVLTRYAGSVRFTWDIPDGLLDRLPVDLWEVSGGGGGGLWSNAESNYLWDARKLPECHEYMQKWVESVSPDEAEHFGLRHKLPITGDGSGNLIALDGSQGGDTWPVVHLSHDNADEHLIRLGENFADFITRWSRLGCPGPDLHRVEPFYNRRSKQISETGRLAKHWLRWLEEGK